MKINEMLKEVTVKENDMYVNGRYVDRKPVFGYYTQPIKNSLLDRIEIMAKGKFKLEHDSENYAHEARLLTHLAIEEFLKNNEEYDKDYLDSWVYKTVKNKLQNKARDMKSNNSNYNRDNNKYEIKDVVSIHKLVENKEEPIVEYLEEIKSPFLIWLENEGKDVLTKKQIDYLKNDLLVNPSNVKSINNRIANKIIKHYGEYQKGLFEDRNKVIKNNFINSLIDKINNDCFEEYMCILASEENPLIDSIIEKIYDELTFEQGKEFAKCLLEGRCVSNKTRLLIKHILRKMIQND